MAVGFLGDVGHLRHSAVLLRSATASRHASWRHRRSAVGDRAGLGLAGFDRCVTGYVTGGAKLDHGGEGKLDHPAVRWRGGKRRCGGDVRTPARPHVSDITFTSAVKAQQERCRSRTAMLEWTSGVGGRTGLPLSYRASSPSATRSTWARPARTASRTSSTGADRWGSFTVLDDHTLAFYRLLGERAVHLARQPDGE